MEHEADGGVLAGLRFKNNGTTDQLATVLIEVLDSNGTVVSSTSESLGVVSGQFSYLPRSFIRVSVRCNRLGSAPGTYTLRATIFSDSGEDYTPEDNVISKTIVFYGI